MTYVEVVGVFITTTPFIRRHRVHIDVVRWMSSGQRFQTDVVAVIEPEPTELLVSDVVSFHHISVVKRADQHQ